MSNGLYTVRIFDPLRDPRWPEFLRQHPYSSVFHSPGWLRALQVTYGYRPVAFTTSSASQELRNALLFCAVKSRLTGNRLVSLPFSDHCEPLVDGYAQFNEISFFVESVRKKEHWKYIEMRTSNGVLPFDSKFHLAKTYYWHWLDLGLGLDDLRRRFHKNCIQRKIRRAEREGLVCDVGRSESLLQQFYRLILLTRLRQGLPPQPIEWFRNLLAFMGEDACLRIASVRGQPVAGLLTLRHGEKMVYKYGGSDSSFHNLGGVPFLLWQAIKEAKLSGLKVFDFGRSDAENHNLIAFKERWSTSRGTISRWVNPHGPGTHFLEAVKIRIAKRLCAKLPSHALILAGRFFYRHIG